MAARDPRLKEFMDGWFEPLDDDLAELRRKNEEEGVPLIMRETECTLRLLLDFIRPQRILELGTAHGYSALFFARFLPGAAVTTIDRDPHMIGYAESSFAAREEGRRIEFIHGDALLTLSELADKLSEKPDREKFDFVFIDAGKSHYREFLELCERVCTKDAVIVCDNVLMKGWVAEADGKAARRHRTNIRRMQEFLEYIHGRDDLDVTIMSGADGLAVIRFRRTGNE